MHFRWLLYLLSPAVCAIEVKTVAVSSAQDWLGGSIWGWLGIGVLAVLTVGLIVRLYVTQARLRKQQEKMQAIWSNMPDVVIEVDAQGVIKALNRRFSQNSDIESFIGTSSYDYLSDEGQTLFRQHLTQALETSRPCEYEVEIRHEKLVTYSYNRMVPLLSADDERVLVIITDVTRYKEAELILQKGKQQSERVLQSKAQFLLNVSQEMSGPITILKDSIRDLKQADAATTRQLIHAMKASVEHVSQIMGDMSVLAQSKEGELSLESVNTSLWHIIDDIEALYTNQAKQNNISLNIHHQVLPHHIQTDAFRLRQVLYSLMSCHLGICHKGTLDLEIRQTELANEPVIQFMFTNEVSPSTQDSWIAFFNDAIDINLLAGLDPLSIANIKVCNSLVSHLQGIMGAKALEDGRLQQWFILPLEWVYQQERFSIFKLQPVCIAIKNPKTKQWFETFFESLQLPIIVINTAEDVPPTISLLVSDHLQLSDSQWIWWVGDDHELRAPQGAQLHAPYRREALFYRLADYQASHIKDTDSIQKARILLVEDNLNNQLVIQRTLEKLGYSVVLANNGEEGVAQFIAEPVDCIIMDILMPVMDGIEATRQIRKMDRPYVPIIALTANSQIEVETACYEVGMDSFLAKPISRQAIKTVLEQFLGKQPSYDPESTQ